MELTTQQQAAFTETLWDNYARHGRGNLPWRTSEPDGSFDPYKILVSELMLQQTQVPRVIPKYAQFLERFPTVQVLAQAELGDVLRIWQGLGYNRRAKYLHQTAQIVYKLSNFPMTLEELVKLPGVGINTAGAIMAYAFNQPVVFIETNVRTVYIHHFLHDQTDVPDTLLRMLVEQTLDHENPREFYWALMDYGSYLKATVGNPGRASKHYARQSAFHGSRRQVRGQIIRLLGTAQLTYDELKALIADDRLDAVLDELTQESLIHQTGGKYSL